MNTILSLIATIGLIALVAIVLGFAIAVAVASYSATIQLLLG